MNNKKSFSSKYFLSVANLCRRRGFTLVELIITLGIVSLLFIVMVPVLHSYDMKNRLKHVADQYQSMLLEARNYAMAPRAGDINPTKYAVKLVHDNTGQIISIEKGYYEGVSDYHMIESRKMPSGIKEISRCPAIVDGAGDMMHSIDFNIPDASVRFDNIFDGHNKPGNSSCTQNQAVPTWTGDASGNGVIQLIQVGGGSACFVSGVTCQVIKVNSNSGQVSLESVTTPY